MSRHQKQKETALVRTLCYVLGVAPDEFGLAPDPDGWVKVKELVKALHEEEGWRHLRETMIQEAALRLAPQDLELRQGAIRCLSRQPPRPQYGVEAPPHLYLALRPRAWPVVRQQGLQGTEDDPVILTLDQDFALRLGRRRTADPVLITVQAQPALDQGADFALLGSRLYLTYWVPADCLQGPPVSEKPPERKPAKVKIKQDSPAPGLPAPDAMPGSFLVSPEDMEKPYKQKGLRKKIKWKEARRKQRRQKG
ncbi:MAG: RNA 2'-phosphotransferase [Desulfarculaceae bacterium]|jgi:putative RNA 2'-phosphotransferase